MTRSPRRRRQKIDTTAKILLVAFVVVGILLAFVGGKFVFNLVKGWSLTSLPGAPVSSGDSGTNTASNNPLQQSGNAPEGETWDGKSRINILLLGLDYSERRQAQDQGSPLSDTMILATIDPLTKTIGVMSIRRDLWVDIPGYGYNKINTAYKVGVDDNYPNGGGPGLAMDTVEGLLGVPINYYAKVDFNTFKTLIDEIGGVPITLTQEMCLDWEGKGHVFCIPAGFYTLPGSYALAYARTRDAEYGDGDIDRGNRQMEVILAIRDRVLNPNTFATLIAKAKPIYDQIIAGLETNMSLDQAIQLAYLVVQIPRDNMTTYNIDYTVASPETTAEGQWIMRPIPDELRKLRDQMFTASGVAAAPIIAAETGTQNSGDPLTLAIAEGARIQVLNGTNTAGLADTTAAYLTSQGLTVTSTGDTDASDSTTIIWHSSTPYAISYLASLMQVTSSRIYSQNDPTGTIDVTVILGADWAASNPMQ